MTRKEKLLEKVRKNPRNVSKEEFESLIRLFGYIEEGGNHPLAIIGDYTLPYKRENSVKLCYIKDLIEIIDSISKTTRKRMDKQ
ncbi:MAG: toxin HicA [Dehalococcoidia bacterium]